MLATMQLGNPMGSVYQPRRMSYFEVVVASNSSAEVAASAFANLSRWFLTSVFDLRRTDFQEFTESFRRIKNQTEALLNSGAFDRDRIMADFNTQASQTLKSADNFKLDVMSRMNRHGNIELLFMEQ
jgi:hypothetical protein